MSDIVERLNDIWRDDDHERGCTGRNYECTCGFDARSFATAKEAAIEIERLRAKLAEARADALEEAASTAITCINPADRCKCSTAYEIAYAIRALKSGGANG